jgi:hypothetical protein
MSAESKNLPGRVSWKHSKPTATNEDASPERLAKTTGGIRRKKTAPNTQNTNAKTANAGKFLKVGCASAHFPSQSGIHGMRANAGHGAAAHQTTAPSASATVAKAASLSQTLIPRQLHLSTALNATPGSCERFP